MICKVQTLIPGMDPTAFPDTAWQDYSGPNAATIAEQEMTRSITTAGLATWKLTPKLPFSRTVAPIRLAFVEYERVNAGLARGRVVFAATHIL